jgi:predicted TIM-barrel fold metal-dependent hydrolase
MDFRTRLLGRTAILMASVLLGAGIGHSGTTPSAVKAKGFVQCGVNQGLSGFSNPDDKGAWSGLDVDVCRAVTAAIFGDRDKVKFRATSAKDRFTALQSGEVDLLSRYDKGGGLAPFRMPTIMTCFSLMMSEGPQLFPNLRWGFIESSAQWVPWIVNETKRRSASVDKTIPGNPLKAFKINITAQTDDDIPYLFKYAGEDNIVIGTDYGHTDASSEVDAIAIFREMSDVSDSAKRKVLSDNPKALFRL